MNADVIDAELPLSVKTSVISVQTGKYAWCFHLMYTSNNNVDIPLLF